MIKYILFDVSGTLLHKPIVHENILKVLHKWGYSIQLEKLKLRHKLLSELIFFPDRTDEVFYQNFNSKLLYALGIVPSKALLDEIYTVCTYMPWEKYDDTEVLKEFKLPLGIISNFNTTLREKLEVFFGDIFKDVLVSEELGVAKPDLTFYQKALEQIPFAPDEILYIGDSIKLDLEPASQLGIKSLLIDREGFYLKTDYTIANLSEINKYLV